MLVFGAITMLFWKTFSRRKYYRRISRHCDVFHYLVQFCFLTSSEDPNSTPSAESLQFDLGTIRDATDYFSEANKLGEGGFGPVYKVIRCILMQL